MTVVPKKERDRSKDIRSLTSEHVDSWSFQFFISHIQRIREFWGYPHENYHKSKIGSRIIMKWESISNKIIFKFRTWKKIEIFLKNINYKNKIKKKIIYINFIKIIYISTIGYYWLLYILCMHYVCIIKTLKYFTDIYILTIYMYCNNIFFNIF